MQMTFPSRLPATELRVTAVFVLRWSLEAALRADVALFVALHSLALHGRLRQLPWACAAMAGALGLVAARVSTAVAVWDALFFLLSTATAALALGLMIRIRRAQLAGLRDRAARLEIERDQRGRLAVAAERTRVAREMHDIVGHNLSVIITLADAGAYATAVAPERGREALHLIPRLGPGGPRTRPDRVRADKAYASWKNRADLRRRGIRCTIPDKADQVRNCKKRGFRAGGRRSSTHRTTRPGTRSSAASIATRGTAPWPPGTTNSRSATR